MEYISGYLFIFFARVTDVTLSTIRTLMVVQSRKLLAAVIGFFEVSIYVTALSRVVGNLDNPLNLLSYAFGFACGTYLGITIENKIALGTLAVQIILKIHDKEPLIKELREKGFGITVTEGQGLEGTKEILNVVIKRRDLETLKKKIYEYDPNAFITVNNIKPVSGGFFVPVKK